MGRISNSVRNVAFGLILQFVTAIVSFATRSVMIYSLGIEGVAINGLFTEVISALSLAELGVSSAIVYNLYKPLAEKNIPKINQLMTLFRQAYLAIAAATMLIGIWLCPWIQNLVNGLDYSDGYLRVVFLLFVFQCSSSYLFAYKGTLLNTDQKYRVVALITAVVKCIGAVLQIIGLLLTHNYICYLLISICINLAVNVAISVKVDRVYPFLKKDNRLEKKERREIFANIRNIFFKQLAGKVVDSTDNMLISTLVSTIQVGYYANYLSVIGALKQLAGKVTSGISASMGNLFVSADKEYCEIVFKRLEFLYCSIAMVLSIGTFSSMQPFISLWIGEDYLLPGMVVLWCCINMYCSIAIHPLSLAMSLIGRFDIGRNISICSATVNLIVSVILGKILGMTGIFIGTFCTYVIEFFSKMHYLYKLFLEKKSINSMMCGIVTFTKTLLVMLLMYIFEQRISIENSVAAFLIFGALGVLLCIAITLLTQHKTEQFQYWKQFILNNILRRTKRKS